MTQAFAVLVVTFVVSLIARFAVRRIGRRLVAGGDRPSRITDLTPGLRTGPPDPRRARRVESLVAVVSSIVTVLVWTIGVMIALGAFNINLGPLVASAGIIGVALGFGAQSLVQDFLTGLFMLAEDQFGIGDVIDVGEATGVVESISLRTTSLRAVDGTLWHVPNGQIQRVGNMSQDWARAVLDIGVAYDTDVAHAREVIGQVAHEMSVDPDFDQVVLEDPEILGVETLGADAVVIRTSIKTLPGEQWTVAREMRQRIKLALDANDISIPFPQRELWIRGDGQVFRDGGDGQLATGAPGADGDA
nr:mechanosensitive ion channel family protein [Salsipaludibacter albus]